MAKPKDVAMQIKNLIGEDNIVSYTNCMTRLRVKTKTELDTQNLKELSGVLGVIKAGKDEYQIILGPGFVNKVASEFSKIINAERTQWTGSTNEDIDFKTAKSLVSQNKQKVRGTGGVQRFLSKISKVFTPLIPAFIGAGLLSGIAGIISATSGFQNSETLRSWNATLAVLLTILTNVFVIAVGWKMGEEFGGNPGLSALMAAIYCSFAGNAIAGIFVQDGEFYNFIGITIKDVQRNWLSIGFVNISKEGVVSLGAPHAGLIGAMFSAAITINVEKQFRKFMPGAIDTILTPIIVILLMLFMNIFIVIPIAGYVFTGVAWLFKTVYENPFGAALLAGIFLIALTFGVHQGFLPVYQSLIETTGVNGLFPIMCMGGVAQVGVCIMMWILAGKKSVLRKQISGAIIPGFLGIGEPLLYGISLPRIRPLVTACLAAACGGFIMGALNTWGGIGVGMNAATGPGGLTAAIMMTTQDGNVLVGILTYLVVVVITYAIAMLFCWFSYSKIAMNGSKEMKELFSSEQKTNLQKTFYSFAFATLIGILICWIVWYQKLPKEQKIKLNSMKVV